MSPCTGPDPPSAEDGLLLVRRLLEHDATAPADLAAAFLPSLVRWLRDCNPRVDPDLIAMAANDALVNLIRTPEQYDPMKLPLDAFLRMAARRDLLNLQAKEWRHHEYRSDWNVVAEDDDGGNILGRDDDPSLRLQVVEAEQALSAEVEALAKDWTADERRVLELILAGRTTTEEIAPEIGLGHLPPEDQEREVKRIRDRVNARRKRARGEHE
jgi:hypothetical protein